MGIVAESRNSSGKLSVFASMSAMSTSSESVTAGRSSGNVVRDVMYFVKQRIESQLSFSVYVRDYKETNPFMWRWREEMRNRVIESQNPFVFYLVTLRSFARVLFVNVYSNQPAVSFYFPFISFYNEYCNSLLLRKVHNWVVDQKYALLLQSNVPDLPSHLLAPVTAFNTSFLFEIDDASNTLHFSREVLDVLVRCSASLGLQFPGDSSRRSAGAAANSALYAVVNVRYPHTSKTLHPAGLALGDGNSNSSSPIPERRFRVGVEGRNFDVDVEGIDFLTLFFIPETMSFLVVLQVCEGMEDAGRVRNEVEEVVRVWMNRFYHQLKDVGPRSLCDSVAVHQSLLSADARGHDAQPHSSSVV